MHNIPLLTGAEKAPLSGERAKNIVLFLHGLGSNGDDLIALADVLAPMLPDTQFLSPNAPFPFENLRFSYEWFNLYERTESAMLAGITRAVPILNHYIDRQLERFSLHDDKLCLVGFSQGTMMALHTALRRKKPCAGIVGYSGALLAPALLATEITAKPDILLVHGDSDSVVPPAALAEATKAMKALDVPVTGHLIAGLAHGIDKLGLQYGADFLKSALYANQRDAIKEINHLSLI